LSHIQLVLAGEIERAKASLTVTVNSTSLSVRQLVLALQQSATTRDTVTVKSTSLSARQLVLALQQIAASRDTVIIFGACLTIRKLFLALQSVQGTESTGAVVICDTVTVDWQLGGKAFLSPRTVAALAVVILDANFSVCQFVLARESNGTKSTGTLAIQRARFSISLLGFVEETVGKHNVFSGLSGLGHGDN